MAIVNTSVLHWLESVLQLHKTAYVSFLRRTIVTVVFANMNNEEHFEFSSEYLILGFHNRNYRQKNMVESLKISYEQRQNIFDEIVSTEIFDSFVSNQTLIDFISRVWPIWEMKSNDARFRNKADDIRQHYVRNFDGTWRQLFIEELRLLSEPEKYLNFLNFLTCVELYKDSAEYQTFICTVQNKFWTDNNPRQ